MSKLPVHSVQNSNLFKVQIIRLVTVGTVEEKIFQRQITKQGIGDGVANGASEAPSTSSANNLHFTKEELRDLFSLNEDTLSDTHDLLGCDCFSGNFTDQQEEKIEGEEERDCQLGGGGSEATAKASSSSIMDLLKWKHIIGRDVDDEILTSHEQISCVFINQA